MTSYSLLQTLLLIKRVCITQLWGMPLIIAIFPLCMAQNADTAFILPAQTILAQRTTAFWGGAATLQLDSTDRLFYAGSEMAELLAAVSPVVVRSYSPGGLATIAVRGLGSQQTVVEWNGFNIQSPMNGIADMNLVNLFFVDDVAISFANQSFLSSTANIGGGIQLNNRPRYGSGLTVRALLGIGSYGRQYEAIQAGYGHSGYCTTFRARYESEKNDYVFKNPTLAGNPVSRQKNAGSKQLGFMYELYGKWGAHNEGGLIAWYEGSRRQIPAPVTAGRSVAWQEDETVRVIASWKRQLQQLVTEVKSGWFYEELYYSDSLTGIFSNNLSQSSLTEAETRWQATRNLLLSVGGSNQFRVAKADAYLGRKWQNQAALFALCRGQLLSGKITAALSIRQGLVNNHAQPITASVSFTLYPSRHLLLHVNAARNYRLPTFNDLYWQPGGNTNLKPEKGWAQELNMTYLQKNNEWELKARVALHSNLVTNWIQWLPMPDNNNLWQPVNQSKVWSRGGETELSCNYRAGKLRLRFQSLASYQRTGKKQENRYNTQFIYVPFVTAQNSLHAGYKNTFGLLQCNYTGKRYTTTDNSRQLPPFWLVNIGLMQQITAKKITLTLQGKLNNLLNRAYEMIAYRPMPLRLYEVSANFTLPDKLTKTITQF